MQVNVEAMGPCRRVVGVEVEAEQVDRVWKTVLGEVRRQAKIPGFRPGKAPDDLIQKRYQKHIQEQVRDRVLPESYQAALKEKDLAPVAVLDVKEEELKPGAPFSFAVTCDVAPEFDLPTYKGIEVKAAAIEVTDEDVQRVIDSIRERAGTWQDVEGRPAALGDLVQIDYSATRDGAPLADLPPAWTWLAGGTDEWLPLEAETYLPGLASLLEGASVGEERRGALSFPDDHPVEALRGQAVDYGFTLKGLRERSLPAFDEAFVKQAGFESEEAMRARIRDDLRVMRENEDKERRQGEIVQFLLNQADFEVPESLAEQETERAVYSLVRRQRSAGMTEEQVTERQAETFEMAQRQARERLRLQFLVGRIAQAEGIAVADREVRALAERMAGQSRVPVADFLKRVDESRLRADLLQTKVLDFLTEAAKLTES